jgi:hypothetical protein
MLGLARKSLRGSRACARRPGVRACECGGGLVCARGVKVRRVRVGTRRAGEVRGPTSLSKGFRKRLLAARLRKRSSVVCDFLQTASSLGRSIKVDGVANPRPSPFFFSVRRGSRVPVKFFPLARGVSEKCSRRTAAFVVFRGAREAMASPGAYASPLRENQVGLFGDGVAQPPTPNTNVRVLIAQKEKVRVRVAPGKCPAKEHRRRIRAFVVSLRDTRACFSTRAPLSRFLTTRLSHRRLPRDLAPRAFRSSWRSPSSA